MVGRRFGMKKGTNPFKKETNVEKIKKTFAPKGLKKIDPQKQKYRKPGFSGFDIVSSSARMRKSKPGKSFIELDARINRKNLRDYYKSLPPSPKGKK